ncbi:hypothetical protein JXO52_06410 [bacterium]|nr:hypothetical protein [bacterium]
MMETVRSRIYSAAVILVFICLYGSVRAQVEDALVSERLQAITTMLQSDKPGADRWWYGWLIGYGAATAAQGAIGLSSDEKTVQQDMGLGAATTLLGTAGQLLMPLVPAAALKKVAAMPESTPAEREAKLAAAERALEEFARREKSGKSWQTHALSTGVNLASGLVVWLGFKRSLEEGLIYFALNEAVTEIQIWTQPTRAVRDWERYRAQYAPDARLGYGKPPAYWAVTTGPGRLGVSYVF